VPTNPPSNQAGNPNDPKKVSVSGKVSVEYDPKSLNDISKAIRDQTSAQQNTNNASGGISESGIKQQKRANNIALIAVGLSAVAFVATLAIIVLNYKAINAADKSAAIADTAIIENRKQFQLSNRPFIELASIGLDSVGDGKRPFIKYDLTNTGHFPAEVTRFRSAMDLFIKNATDDTVIHMLQNSMTVKNESKIGIVPFYPIVNYQSTNSTTPFPKQTIDSIRKGLAFFGLIMEVKYRDLLTKDPYLTVRILKIEDVNGKPTYSSLLYTDGPDSSK
jgi:hypothetical protein